MDVRLCALPYSATKIEKVYCFYQLKLLAERRLLGVFQQLGDPGLLSGGLTAL